MSEPRLSRGQGLSAARVPRPHPKPSAIQITWMEEAAKDIRIRRLSLQKTAPQEVLSQGHFPPGPAK